MKNVIEFLSELTNNNNKEWFDANRSRYEGVNRQFNIFVEELIAALSGIDETLQGLTTRDCTYRIYRDVRFAKDKRPYKTFMGAYVCRGGKKSAFGGYYVHIQPSLEGEPNYLLSSGIYMPEPIVLRSIREEIVDHGDLLMENISKAKGFVLSQENALKRDPKGFENYTKHSELLKNRDMHLVKVVDESYLLKENLVRRLVEEFATTKKFLDQINRSVEFAKEEMGA